jgi:ligand-binding sensor domain-containing protein
MRKTALGFSAALTLAALAFACIALRRFNVTLRSARQQVSRENSLAFSLEPVVPASWPAFEAVGTADTPTTAAVFSGKLYLAGPSGLAVYDSPMTAPHRLRTGVELPPAPILALTVAHLRGHPAPELLGITHGAGLLLFDAHGPPRQLLPSAPEARDLTSILPLSSGDLLLGTRHAGLLIFDGNQLRSFSPTLAHLDVTALAGSEADFWVGTRDRGLLHWHSGELDSLDTNAGLPDNTILSLVDSPRGMFAGTPLGIAQIVNGRVNRQLGRGLFAQSLAVQADSLLVATVDQGMTSIALNVHSQPAAFHAPSGPEVTTLISSGDSVLGISHGSLLRRSEGGGWLTVLAAPPQTVADSNVAALDFSPDGRLWIGYFDHGLDVLDLATDRAHHLEDDHLYCVNRIVADPTRHTMDVATANGLVLLDPTAATPVPRQVMTRRDGLAADQVTDVAFSGNGTMLATPSGVTVLTPSGPESLSSFQGLANDHVYALAADPASSSAMVGTLAGVSIVDHLNVTASLSLRNSSLPRNWITAIARVGGTVTQPVWFVGTYGGGVVQMDAAGHVNRLDTPAPTAVINSDALLVTADHVLAGTLDGGLLVYNRGTQHWTQITAGLPSLNVTAFAARGGEIYIGTADGIVRLPEQALP